MKTSRVHCTCKCPTVAVAVGVTCGRCEYATVKVESERICGMIVKTSGRIKKKVVEGGGGTLRH